MTAGRAFARVLLAALALGTAISCAAPATTDAATGNGAALRAFNGHVQNAEITIDGVVERVLADQSGPSGPHQRFIVRLTDVDLTLLIEHNLTLAPRVPVAAGQRVTIRGEYVWNAQGGLLHFTHHDPDGSHQAGYIVYAGKRYD